jgi:integrase/recombinase XerC
MHLFKPSVTKAIPDHAERFTRKGVQLVRWVGRGNRKIEGIVSKTNPDRCRIESPVFHIAYVDHLGRRRSQKAYADRTSSEAEMARLRLRLAQIKCGDISPARDKRGRKTPADLLDEWIVFLRDNDRNEIYVKNCDQRVRAILDRVGATDLTDLDDGKVSSVLRAMQSTGGMTKKRISAQTANHYLVVLKSFLKWCESSGYLERSPIRELRAIECDSKRTFERRSLTRVELDQLVEATIANTLHRGVMTGEDRACLYLTAAYTGFRVRELASLTPESFSLDTIPPTIELHGRSAKNRKTVVQPFQPGLVARFKQWLSDKPPRQPVWPGYAWSRGKSNRMLRTDLRAAKIPEVDQHGRRVDFHAFRTTFATLLAKAGVSIQSAQRLMRHSDPRLTVKHYTKLDLGHLAQEAAKLTG